jgi:hypothetical protein
MQGYACGRDAQNRIKRLSEVDGSGLLCVCGAYLRVSLCPVCPMSDVCGWWYLLVACLEPFPPKIIAGKGNPYFFVLVRRVRIPYQHKSL